MSEQGMNLFYPHCQVDDNLAGLTWTVLVTLEMYRPGLA
jgi:hypothetical protein